MKRIIILSSLLLFAIPSMAQIKFAYDVKASTSFDNREYDNTKLDDSRTLFGIRLCADAGISFEKGKSTHRLLAGVDPLYEFGGDFIFQPLLYYKFDTRLQRSKFSIDAGIFPRSESRAFYSLAFFSDANRFYDDTYEGLQFSWKGRKFYYELGLDWKGMIGKAHPERREEFMVYSGGHHSFIRFLKLGYSAYMHHYANNYSLTANNVVDDILISPYVDMDFGQFVGMQLLRTRLSYLQGFQRDRGVSSDIQTPAKGEFLFEVRKWNVGIANDLFFGGDLMPLYDLEAPEGGKYADKLYMGDPFMRNAEGKSFIAYDRLGVYWAPRIADKLSLRVQVNFHFNGGFAGHNELISVAYQL